MTSSEPFGDYCREPGEQLSGLESRARARWRFTDPVPENWPHARLPASRQPSPPAPVMIFITGAGIRMGD
jgi:hypothetical protein